jgi:hypothetical protein
MDAGQSRARAVIRRHHGHQAASLASCERLERRPRPLRHGMGACRQEDAATVSPVGEVADRATVTCPHCGVSRLETMPTNACQHFYRCEGCGEILSPRKGDCCVFCSYADHHCPPEQVRA